MLFRKVSEWLEIPLNNGFTLNNRYQIKQYIGKGSYGLVYEATDELRGESVIVKQLRNRKRAQNKELLVREARMLKSLNLSNTPALVDYFQVDQKYYLVMEHKAGKNFEELVMYEGNEYSEVESIQILLKVLRVVEHLHHRNIVHRDLRLPNILFHGDQIIIIDFGLAIFADEGDLISKVPTSLAKRLYREPSVKSDFYALGNFILFLLYSSYQVTSRKERSWEEELTISPELKRCIRKMLQLDQEYATVNEIIEDLEFILANQT
ncbi:serine/threonine protein kinase [Bacillus sp. PS06]|uniref:serine/threonine protein kinase n=1 Tax=Bacillus sp. PS06 TaxID=2764176 RepID=UPI00177CAF57|nr:protein kinase family protein [Bacillus sp. PS06]MBD8071474.1 protein kinase family protein [Bacillus sp. PS06]